MSSSFTGGSRHGEPVTKSRGWSWLYEAYFKSFHLNPYLLASLLHENGQKSFQLQGASPCWRPAGPLLLDLAGGSAARPPVIGSSSTLIVVRSVRSPRQILDPPIFLLGRHSPATHWQQRRWTAASLRTQWRSHVAAASYTKSSPAIHHLLKDTSNSAIEWSLCPGYSTTQVWKLDEKWRTFVAGTPGCLWQCVTVHHPAAGSTCITGILYEYRVADCQRAKNVLTVIWTVHVGSIYAILAHSWYTDGNYDSALNSPLRHVTMQEQNASSVSLKSCPRVIFTRNIGKRCG